jgi:ABC-type phosphate transport system ATPase subunit
MRVWRHVPNSLRNKNLENNIPYPIQKVGFGASECLFYPSGIGKKTFLSTLNAMILQIVRIECIRFGGHAHLQIRYKILQLKVL